MCQNLSSGDNRTFPCTKWEPSKGLDSSCTGTDIQVLAGFSHLPVTWYSLRRCFSLLPTCLPVVSTIFVGCKTIHKDTNLEGEKVSGSLFCLVLFYIQGQSWCKWRVGRESSLDNSLKQFFVDILYWPSDVDVCFFRFLHSMFFTLETSWKQRSNSTLSVEGRGSLLLTGLEAVYTE